MKGRGMMLVVLVVIGGCVGGVTPGEESATGTEPAGQLEVHFINVGQSVATLLVGPTGETMLIDTGHYDDDGKYVLSYLKRHDIERIDHLVTSHNDADHIGGHAAVIDYYETEADGIGAVYDPGIAASTQTYESYLDAVERHDVSLIETRAGDGIPFEGVTVDVFGPPEPYLANEERNENSVVLRVAFGQTSFLFTGDAEDDQEAALIDRYGDRLHSTVLKAGHHGSSSSTSGPLLDAVDPSAVVVSSDYDSRYGHPTEAVLGRLADREIPTYWTATAGHVVFTSDGSSLTVATQAAAPTDPSRLREGEPVAPGTSRSVERRAVIQGDAPAAPTAVTDGGTEPPGSLAVVEINADAEGDDRSNLNGEYITFENTGSEPLEVGGWEVTDAAGASYTIPAGVTLDPGERVTLYTGAGTDTDDALYWGAASPVWNNAGDTITVRNASGGVVLQETYE